MLKVCLLVASVVLAGAMPAAAQGPEHGKQDGGHGGPHGGPGPGPGAHAQPGGPGPRQSAPPSAPPHPAARAPSAHSAPPAAAERHRAQEHQRASERARAAEKRQVNERQAEQHRATEQKREAEHRAAEQRRQAEQTKAAEQRRSAEQRKASEQKAVEQKREAEHGPAQRPDAKQSAGANQPAPAKYEQLRQERGKLSADQRHRLRQGFVVNREHITRAHFTRRVGTRIPRSVRLFVVPAAALAIFPYYRDYRYVVEEDTICIVDPDTYEIVDVLEEGPYAPGSRPQVAELTLTDSQRALVLDSIPADFPRAHLHLRLALGAEIPPSVETYEFAPIVLDRIPKLHDFRFVVSDDQVVIVAPQDRSIALVLDR
jgi:uncharacterized protein DUF1236